MWKRSRRPNVAIVIGVRSGLHAMTVTEIARHSERERPRTQHQRPPHLSKIPAAWGCGDGGLTSTAAPLSSTSGSASANTLPASEDAPSHRRPPCSSASLRLMLRPSPVPETLRAVPLEADSRYCPVLVNADRCIQSVAEIHGAHVQTDPIRAQPRMVEKLGDQLAHPVDLSDRGVDRVKLAHGVASDLPPRELHLAANYRERPA